MPRDLFRNETSSEVAFFVDCALSSSENDKIPISRPDVDYDLLHQHCLARKEVTGQSQAATQNLFEAAFAAQIAELRDHFDPLKKGGQVLHLGNGPFSRYGANRLHEYLDEALMLLGGQQQGIALEESENGLTRIMEIYLGIGRSLGLIGVESTIGEQPGVSAER